MIKRISLRWGAEAGFGLDEEIAPLRPSGFVCLILGLLSVVALVGPAALLVPIAAIIAGAIALRRYGEQVPVGIGAARVGLVLAVLFGSCGFFIPWFKNATLGGQAERFARDYIEVVARDEVELALELRKDYNNRFPDTMPLKDHYQLTENGEEAIQRFRTDSINQMIRDRGPNAEWVLDRAVRVYNNRRFLQADMVFKDPTGESRIRLYVGLEYNVDHRNGDGQWYVIQSTQYSEPIVAPSIL